MGTTPVNLRNKSLWERVLPEVVEWLDANPLASCSDAGRKFNINQATLNGQLALFYPGRFDFNERRRLRGVLNKKPKVARGKVNADIYTEMHKITELFGEVINGLARIEQALVGEK